MKSKNTRFTVFFMILVLFPFIGCACSSYGKLHLEFNGKDRLSIARLAERWQDYEIHYAGVSVHRPSAILFDPKGDDRALEVHRWWIRVDRKETLLELVKWLRFNPNYEPAVRSVLSPDDRLFGYMYTAWYHARILVKDEKTLWVDDLSIPPEYRDSGNFEKVVR